MKTAQKANIKLVVISSKGDETFLLTPTKAVEKIKKEVNSGKWFFRNLEYVNTDTLEASLLNEHDDYILSNALLGGICILQQRYL